MQDFHYFIKRCYALNIFHYRLMSDRFHLDGNICIYWPFFRDRLSERLPNRQNFRYDSATKIPGTTALFTTLSGID